MACRIRRLDEATVALIAAGEVVERPASVVKELVENALDAGARRVQVALAGGGAALVEVADDGCGMAPEEVRLAVERHATSKIATAADLERVRTLGFRGEALPSIAAVSRLEIVTREPGGVAGTRLVVRAGREEAWEPAAAPAGTRVTVTELFFNTPARRKHLKSPAYELDRCLRTATALALARPQVAVQVRHGGRLLLATPGGGDLAAAVAAALGPEVGAALLPVRAEADGMLLEGFVGAPAAARATRVHQFFFVNGRPALGYPLAEALAEAFAGLLPGGRHPAAFLALTLDPREVDVNVHPAKLRVRFRAEGAVARLVRGAVRAALERAGVGAWAPGWRVAETPAAYRVGGAGDAAGAGAVPAAPGGPAPGGAWDAAAETALASLAEAAPAGAPAPWPAGAGRWPPLRVVGQVDATYILAEGPDGLYIVDQHAAHERIQFERFRRLRASGRPAGQPLAAPLPVRVGPGLVAVWAERWEALAALGFAAEPFGPDTLLLRQVPALLAGGEGAEAFRDLLERLAAAPAGEGRAGAALEWLAGRACKAAVRARDPLTPPEQERLLADLAQAEHPFTCPHGRPTVVRLSRRDLERLFGRA